MPCRPWIPISTWSGTSSPSSWIAALSEGMRTIVLTVALAAAAALLFPVKDEEAKEEAP